MIGGISNASVFPKTPSLIAKDEPKPFVLKVEEKKVEKELRSRGTSAPNENSKNVIERPPSSSPIRYGEAPSAIDRKVDTGLNTSGLREFEPSKRPENLQRLDEARDNHNAEHLDRSTGGGNRTIGIRKGIPENPSEEAKTLELQGTHPRPSEELARSASAPLYEQLKREYIQKKEETPSTGTVLNETA